MGSIFTKTVPITDSEGSEKQRRIAKGRSHYIALAALAVGVVIIVILIALLKADIIGDDDDEEEVEQGPSKTERLEATRDSLQGLVGSTPNVRLESFSNWDGTTTRKNVFVVAPTNLAEIQRVVVAARWEGLKLRCVGSAYSFSDLYADEEQLIVETNQLKTRQDGEPIELNQPVEGVDFWTVTAAAGMDQGEIKQFFLDNKVQYRSTATPWNVLIGGLISTAAHGASAVRGSVSDEVVAVRLVDAMGNLRSYNSLQHPDYMAMLRCCVGMCGVIYDITFKVETLTVANVDNVFMNSYELFSDTATLVNDLQTTDMLMYWAPLSSLTDEQWLEYNGNGKIPDSYDPWNDQYWIRTYTATDQTELTTRRRRSVNINAVPPLLTGHINGVPLARHRRDVDITTESPATITTESPIVAAEPETEGPVTAGVDEVTTGAPMADEPVATTAGEPEATTMTTYTTLQDIHQGKWNETYNMFNEVPPEDMYYPDAVMFQNGETLDITYSMAFTFKDDATLSNTQKVMTTVLDKLKEEAVAGRMPVTTLELDWIQPSRECYLCAQNTAKDDTDTAYWLSLTFISASYKPDYEPFMNMIFNALKEEFPSGMRVEWAKFYSFVDDLQPFIRDSFGDAMEEFKDAYEKSGIDPANPDYRFINQYLRKIFNF